MPKVDKKEFLLSPAPHALKIALESMEACENPEGVEYDT